MAVPKQTFLSGLQLSPSPRPHFVSSLVSADVVHCGTSLALQCCRTTLECTGFVVIVHLVNFVVGDFWVLLEI